MNQRVRIPFMSPMQSLRRAAWTIAAQGHPVAWCDPMPAKAGRS